MGAKHTKSQTSGLDLYHIKVRRGSASQRKRRLTDIASTILRNPQTACTNCTGRWIKDVVGNCEKCDALFEDLIRDPIEMEFGSELDIEYVRNHVMIYGCKFGDAQRVARLILTHLGLALIPGAVARAGKYAIKFIKIGAPDLDICNNDIDDKVSVYWIGLSFRITPWIDNIADVQSE
jgi:hypothetical protein